VTVAYAPRVLALVVLVSWCMGCGDAIHMAEPSVDGPVISALSLRPDRTTAGCPVEMRFRLDPRGGEIVRAVAGWSYSDRKVSIIGYTVPPFRREPAPNGAGTDVVMTLTPERIGIYRYNVQVDDRTGRKSNVLEGEVFLEAPWPGQMPKCP
jgi:hypothetical protein